MARDSCTADRHPAAGQTAEERGLTGWLAAQRDAMLALLAEVVNIDSGSADKAGVDAVAGRFDRFLGEHGVATTRVRGELRGDVVRAIVPGRGAQALRSFL